MCLIVFAYKIHPDFPLVLAGNRDEFYNRPTRSADFWEESPNLLGGKDLEQGGSWLGLTRSGHFATVTNVRDPAAPTGARSRGHLVTDFLRRSSGSTESFLEALQQQAHEYSGFNLLAGTPDQLFYYSNRLPQAATVELAPGIYGLSNHLLDSPWPKLEYAKAQLHACLQAPVPNPRQLMQILQDETQAAEAQLPDTGVGPAMERFLSSVFIRSESYGTRAGTLILISRQGEVEFVEQNYGPFGIPAKQKQFRFRLQPT